MRRKLKTKPVDLPAIYAELLELALGDELNYHLATRQGLPSRPPSPTSATAQAPRWF